MEIKEVVNDIKKEVGEKPIYIVIAIFIVAFVISLIISKDDSSNTDSESENIAIQGAYASYPDAVTNADTITDTIQQSIDYQTEELSNTIFDSLDQISSSMSEHFDANNQYLIDSIENLKQLEELDTSEKPESADDLESSNEEVLSLYDRINALEYQNKQQQTDFNRQMDEMRIKYEDQITSLSSSYQQQIAGLTAQLNNTFGRG